MVNNHGRNDDRTMYLERVTAQRVLTEKRQPRLLPTHVVTALVSRAALLALRGVVLSPVSVASAGVDQSGTSRS
jgi:hypothetical protein